MPHKRLQLDALTRAMVSDASLMKTPVLIGQLAGDAAGLLKSLAPNASGYLDDTALCFVAGVCFELRRRQCERRAKEKKRERELNAATAKFRKEWLAAHPID